MQYESGFKPAKLHRAAAAGHQLGFVSLGFLQVRRTGKRGCCFPSFPRPVLPKPHTTAARGEGAPGPLLSNHGMGVWSSAPCSTSHSPHPIGQGSTGKAEPSFPWHWMQPVLVPLAWEGLCQGLLCFSAGYSPIPACGSFVSRSISHFRAGCLGWWVQLEGKCRELLSSSCDLPDHFSAACLNAFSPEGVSRLLEELTGATQEDLVTPSWRLFPPQQLPSPARAFSSLTQQETALCRGSCFTTTPLGFLVSPRTGVPCPSPAEGSPRSPQLLC